jgi:hypothetical protein
MAKQKTQMPAFGGMLSEDELELLVDYCLHIYGLGPLDHAGYLDYAAKNAEPLTRGEELEPVLEDESSAALPLKSKRSSRELA